MSTEQDVRNFLTCGWEVAQRLQRCRWNIEKLKARCQRCTASVEHTGGTEKDIHRDQNLAELADQLELERQLERLLTAREKLVEQFLNRLPDVRLQILLKLRYVDQLHWPQVMERMQQVNLYYSERQVYNLHRKGLAQAAELLREEDMAFDHIA